jgi:hypothetical protein
LTFSHFARYSPSVEDQPLHPTEVTKRIREILGKGQLAYTAHARAEMQNDCLTTGDCMNVLRGGIVDPGELVNRTWRYRVHTPFGICFVIAFRGDDELVVITAWRDK